MVTVPAQSFCAPVRARSIAAWRSIPGVWGVFGSSEWPGITRTPSYFHLGGIWSVTLWFHRCATLIQAPFRPRRIVKARFTRDMSRELSRAITRPIWFRRTVVILSTMIHDVCLSRLASVGSICTRKSGASNGSLVIRQRVTDPITNASDCMTSVSLAPPRCACEAACLLGGAQQGLGLVDALLLLGLWIGIGDDACACLHVHHAVLHQRRSQHDGGIHLAGGGEIADGAGIKAALLFLQLIDNFHGAHLRRAGNGAGRKPSGQRVDGILLLGQRALDIRHDVHNLAIAFDKKLVGDRDGADLRYAPDVVSPEIKQHQVLGALLRIGQQLGFERLVIVRGSAAWPRSGNRTNGDNAAAHLHQNLGAGASDGEIAKV